MKTPVTVKTVKTTSDSDSHLLSQPLKGVTVTVNLKTGCIYCQYWAGAADSVKALCRLPRMVHEYSLTGRHDQCPRYTAIDTPDISTQGAVADNGTTGTPSHVELVPANHRATVEIWGNDADL